MRFYNSDIIVIKMQRQKEAEDAIDDAKKRMAYVVEVSANKVKILFNDDYLAKMPYPLTVF